MQWGCRKMDAETVERMLKMLQDGVSVAECSRIFNRDHSTVIYHKKKHGIVVGDVTGVVVVRRRSSRISLGNPNNSVLTDEFGDPVCRGFSYAEYLRVDKSRHRGGKILRGEEVALTPPEYPTENE